MTCVIAHRDGWMVADRRETFSDTLIGPYIRNKIIHGPGLLVAIAGRGDLLHRVKCAMGDTHGTGVALDRIQKLFLDNTQEGHALVLTADGVLCEILSSGDRCCLKPEVTHWSIGSGYQFALGYLAHCEKTIKKITPEDAADAIEFASTRVNDVGDGIQVEKLDD